MRRPIRRRLETAPTRLPHRSQNGTGGPPDGGATFGTRMVVPARALGPVNTKAGPAGLASSGGWRWGPCATDRASEVSPSRPDNTGVR